jgi:hypothetical protein
VQGRYGAVGSDRPLVKAQIAKARKSIATAIALRPGLIAIAGQGAPADVKLVAMKSSRIINIGNGENGGRTIRYSNIVVAERRIGKWDGGAETFPLPSLNIAGADRYAIIVQSGSGPILAGRFL